MGFKEDQIDYEPIPNSTPDFLILPEKIAVEVRRLNYNFPAESKPFEGIEKLSSIILPKLEALFKKFSLKPFKNSAFVSVHFARPLVVTPKLIRIIKSNLESYLPNLQNIEQKKDLKITDNLFLNVWPVFDKFESPYVFGGIFDHDHGGLILADIYRNLLIVKKEKEEKIASHFENYSKWWLMLIDRIGYGLKDNEIEQLSSLNITSVYFEKIVFVNPDKPSDYKILNTNGFNQPNQIS